MRLLLDTNAYSDLGRGRAATVAQVRRAHQVIITGITLAELRAGFLAGRRTAENESNLLRFLNEERVRVVCPDEQTTFHYARLFVQLRRQGTPIPTNDLWIAALAVQHDCMLHTSDRHFDAIPQLGRV